MSRRSGRITTPRYPTTLRPTSIPEDSFKLSSISGTQFEMVRPPVKKRAKTKANKSESPEYSTSQLYPREKLPPRIFFHPQFPGKSLLGGQFSWQLFSRRKVLGELAPRSEFLGKNCQEEAPSKRQLLGLISQERFPPRIFFLVQ